MFRYPNWSGMIPPPPAGTLMGCTQHPPKWAGVRARCTFPAHVSHSEYRVSSLILADWVGPFWLFLANGWCGKSLFSGKWNSVSFKRGFVCKRWMCDIRLACWCTRGLWLGCSISELLVITARQRGTNSWYSCFYALSDAGKCSFSKWQKVLPWPVLLHPRQSRASSAAGTKGQRGGAEAVFLTGTVLLRTPVGAREENRTDVYLDLGTEGDPVMAPCVSVVEGLI